MTKKEALIKHWVTILARVAQHEFTELAPETVHDHCAGIAYVLYRGLECQVYLGKSGGLGEARVTYTAGLD